MKSLEEILKLKPGDLVIARADNCLDMFKITGKTCYLPGQVSMVLKIEPQNNLSINFVALLTKEETNIASLSTRTFLDVFDIIKC